MDMDIELFEGNTIVAGRRAIVGDAICGKCYKNVKSTAGKSGGKLPVISSYFLLRSCW
jgi:hypothetical protein